MIIFVYSRRMACIGSMRAARTAGIRHAITAISSTAAEPTEYPRSKHPQPRVFFKLGCSRHYFYKRQVRNGPADGGANAAVHVGAYTRAHADIQHLRD